MDAASSRKGRLGSLFSGSFGCVSIRSSSWTVCSNSTAWGRGSVRMSSAARLLKRRPAAFWRKLSSAANSSVARSRGSRACRSVPRAAFSTMWLPRASLAPKRRRDPCPCGSRWKRWTSCSRGCFRRPNRSTSAPFPKFVIHCGTLSHELRKQRDTSKYMILVPLFDLKFLNELAGTAVGTSNRRHKEGRDHVPSSFRADRRCVLGHPRRRPDPQPQCESDLQRRSDERRRCVQLATMTNLPSYVQVLTCLEMAREAGKLPEARERGTVGLGR